MHHQPRHQPNQHLRALVALGCGAVASLYLLLFSFQHDIPCPWRIVEVVLFVTMIYCTSRQLRRYFLCARGLERVVHELFESIHRHYLDGARQLYPEQQGARWQRMTLRYHRFRIYRIAVETRINRPGQVPDFVVRAYWISRLGAGKQLKVRRGMVEQVPTVPPATAQDMAWQSEAVTQKELSALYSQLESWLVRELGEQ